MPEATVTPTVAPQPSPPVVSKPAEPAKAKAKGEKAKEFVVLHMGVGPFVKGDKFDAADLFPGDDDVEPKVQRLIDLEAIAPNAE